MAGFLLGIAVVAALVAVAVRRVQRVRAMRRRPGATMERAVTVNRFDEIDLAVQGQQCWCGGLLTVAGETSHSAGDRRYRIVRLVCNRCERDQHMYFDVTAAFQ